ncbi:MAG: phage tail tape measure protein [Promethearchaeota archaeon]
MDIMTRYVLALTSDTRGAREYVDSLKRAELATQKLGVETGKATRLIDQTTTTGFNKAGQSVRKVTAIWQDSFGKIFKTSYQVDKNAITPISSSLNQMGKGFRQATRKANDFTRALRRVLIVVPIWMVFRAIIRNVQNTIRETTDFIVKMDKALARAKATITDTSIDMSKFGEDIRAVARSLAIQTGRPVEDVIEIFYRLSTAGIDAKTSMAGMQGVLKTSIAIMGDTTQTARVLAQTYNLLGKNMADNIPEFKKIELLGAVIARLWQDNQFELNEFTTALERSGSALSQFGVDARTSIALLATLHQQGIKGGRAGRLLQNVFLKLGQNTKVLREEMGILINDNAPIDWFELLTEVMNRVNDMGTQTPKTVQALLEVFRIRGGQGFRALVQDMNKFRDNLQKAGEEATQLFDNLNRLQSIQLDTVEAQLNRFKNLRKEIGFSFITGVTGADSFVKALKAVNEWMIVLIGKAYALGIVFNQLAKGNERLEKYFYNLSLGRKIQVGLTPLGLGEFTGETGEMMENVLEQLKDTFGKTFSEAEMVQIADAISRGLIDEMANKISKKRHIPAEKLKAVFLKMYNTANQEVPALARQMEEFYDKLLSGKLSDVEAQAEIKKINDAINKQVQGLGDTQDDIIDKYDQQIMQLQLQQRLIRLSARGVQEHVIAQEKLVATANRYFDIADKGRKVGVEAITQAEKQKAIAGLLQGNWEVIEELKKKGILSEQQALDLANQLLDVDRKRLELIKRYGDQVKSAFQTTLADALKEGDMESFFTNFADRLRNILIDRLAEVFTENLIAQTGLFATFGQVLSGQQIGVAIQTSGTQHAQMVQRAILTAGQQHAQMVAQATTTATTGVQGIGAISGLPIGYGGKTATIAGMGQVPVAPADYYKTQGMGASSFNWMGSLATLGLMASLFAGSGRKSSMGHAYSTAPGGVDRNLQATTRMTTKAQITNITIAPVFNLKGDITDQRVRNAVADDIIKQVKEGVVNYLDEQNIAIGNV